VAHKAWHYVKILQSPQFWPIPTRTTVQDRCTTAIHPAGYDLSTNQKLCGPQAVLVRIGQNREDCNMRDKWQHKCDGEK